MNTNNTSITESYREDAATRFVLTVNWFLGFIYFRILNRVKISGGKGFPKEKGILYLASHYTMVDSWLIGVCFSPVDAIFRPWIIPHNVPEKTNFYKGKFSSWWFDKSKCIPILRDSGGKNTHPKIVAALERSNVLIFPSSTRYRGVNNKGRNSPSLGRLISNCNARKIIPINLHGLPYKGGFFPVLFKKLEVVIGTPINIDELGPADTKEQCSDIVQNVREIIEAL